MLANKRDDAIEVVQLLNRIPQNARERIFYMIEGAALVTGALDNQASGQQEPAS